ncbi:MAG: hypothetical protein ACKV0T_01900 [Planctomycetales bacterium]
MKLDTLPDDSVSLIDEVERLVRLRTGGLIRELRIEGHSGEIVLHGRAISYYAKQLATHAALDACEHVTLTNDIEVD